MVTKTADDIFDPAGEPILSDVQLWGTEIEALLPVYGSWTPGLAFATPGTSNIVLSTASGHYVKIGREYRCYFDIVTSTFDHGTASGTLRITGLPATVGTAIRTALAEFQGYSKANFTQLSVLPTSGQTIATLNASGSAQTLDTTIATTDFPDDGSVILRGEARFLVSA